MSSGSKGDDAPSEAGRGSGAQPAAAAQRVVVRSDAPTPGDSATMSAADTAMAMASAMTDPEVSHERPLRATPGANRATPGTTRATPGPARPTPSPARATTSDTSPEVAVDPLIDTILNERYQITRKIGQGGMGAVYEAQHTLIGKRVAVKVLLDKYARKEQVVARLEQEARLASSIGHEHIIDITDFGTTSDGRTFVVMEFLEGESLAECLHREGPLPEARILNIVAQVGSALSAAHAKGVVHRDVKPENVFLLRRKDKDYVKVVDFGISKSMRQTEPGEDESPRLTQTGMVLGTPLYMSPEQARGDEELDARIDVYALGVIMYELATGRVPFTGGNYLSIISQVLNDDPIPPRTLRPELSAEFDAVVLRAMAKERDDRYASTDELVADVTALLDDPSRSTQRARILPPRKAGRRGGLRILAWVVGVSVVIAAVVFSVSMMMGGGPNKGVSPMVTPPPPDAAPPPAPPDAAPPPAVEVVKIPIDSKPTGATIYEGGREIGKTPTTYDAPLGNDKVSLIAELAGYDDATFTVNPIVDKDRKPSDPVMVRLSKPQGGAPKKIPKRPPGGGAHPGSGSSGSASPGSGSDDEPTGGGDLEGSPYTGSGQ
ncbi:MAG: protein kinase [Deltaproteobacteria bacterium]|nr:protein kinase [Deltaproteobacteria bacterium]